MSKKFLLVIFVLMAVAAGYYAYLGGFNKPEISVTTSRGGYVAGQYYEGPADSRAFGEYFEKAGQLQTSGTLAGSLANIYYNNPETQQDTIRAFIGVLLADTTVTLPAGFAWRRWPADSKVVRVSTRAHYLLAPNKLYPALFDYLKENKLETRAQYLELFPEKDQALVEVLLAN